jgi:hypothetical protein
MRLARGLGQFEFFLLVLNRMLRTTTTCTPTLYCAIRDDPHYPEGKLAYRVLTPVGVVPRQLDITPPLIMLQGMTAVKEDWFSFAGTSLSIGLQLPISQTLAIFSFLVPPVIWWGVLFSV